MRSIKSKFFKIILGSIIVCSIVGITFLTQRADKPSTEGMHSTESDAFVALQKKLCNTESYKDKLKNSIVVLEGPNHYRKVVTVDGVTERSQFPIGSISKQFTAVLLLKALSNKNSGNLDKIRSDLHTPLSILLEGSDLQKKLQNVPTRFKDRKPKNWLEQVTLHDLLCHTSGLDDIRNAEHFKKYFGDNRTNWPSSITPIELLQCIRFKKQAEVKFNYSNANYVFIAKIIEHFSRKDFEVYLKEQITTPLNLANTLHMRDGTISEIKAKHHAPNLIKTASSSARPDLSFCFGACSLVSTANDLMVWTKALHTGDVLSKDLYNLMTAKYVNIANNYDYCYGIAHSSSIYGEIIFHDGDMDDYRSMAVYFPRHRLFFVFLTANQSSQNIIRDKIFR